MPSINKKPCEECPFRRNSAPGYLGASSPKEFIETAMADVPMPCHLSINYDNPKWKENWDRSVEQEKNDGKKYCAGTAIFFSNTCKLSRDKKRPKLPPDHEAVFSSRAEFLQHHEDPDDYTP